MNIYKYFILVKGEDKTASIEKCIYENGKYNIVYENNPKVWSYNYLNVEKFTDPKSIPPSSVSVCHDGRRLFNIQTILEFGGEYWRIIYQGGKVSWYHKRNLVIEKNSLLDVKIRNAFEYFKALADEISIKTDEGNSLLADQYKKIDFVGEHTALTQYLSPSKLEVNKPLPQCIIYPFGCNMSQMEAIEKALTHQISVIEGPPGTGKTQTILNLIANLVMEGKTVAVVSNNNAATENVYEKLEKNGFSFIAATLGKVENKKYFIEHQPPYPDFDLYPKEISEIFQFKSEMEPSQNELKTMLEQQNEIASLKSQLDAIKLEHEYFKIYYEETYKKTGKLQKLANLKVEEALKLWVESQGFLERNKKLSFWFKLKGFLWYRIYDWEFFKQPIEIIISDFQYIYYELKIKVIKENIMRLEKALAHFSFKDKLAQMSQKSMEIFKHTLWERYGQSNERLKFQEEDLWKHSKQVLQEYPVILSTTYSIKNSLNSETIYDYMIVDEASQVDLITGVLTLSCARNIVIVGDLMQLPNVVKDETKVLVKVFSDSVEMAEGYRYECNSLLSSIPKVIPSVPRTLLREHYRCHPKIIEFCNKKFYNNQLIIMTEDKGEQDVLKVYKTVAGNHARGHLNQRQLDEIQKVILPDLQLGQTESDIGIISPYRKQTKALEGIVKEEIDISTVHKFQGREKEDIIISTVDNEISEFADDPNLLNVAVSRAKKRLRLVVSENEKNDNTNIGDLIKYIQYHNFQVVTGQVYSVFDLLYLDYSKERAKYLKKQKNISEYDSENIMYVLIKDVLDEHKFQNFDVLIHQPLKMLIRNIEELTEEECRYAMHYATHIDFLIYNKLDKQPILAIEVDGYRYHKEGTKQYKRDQLKDSILKKYQIPLERFKTNGSNEKERLTKSLYEMSGKSRKENK